MKTRKLLTSLSLIFASLLSLAGFTGAWLEENENIVPDIIGETGRQYFDSEFDGNTLLTDGSEAHPFLITRPVHFYNLSKLQNAGALEGRNFYFQIGRPTTLGATTYCTYGTDDSTTCVENQAIDMSTRVIEPIGYREGELDRSFKSVLHGNGIVIKNLVVENPVTDTGALYDSVGVFGVVSGTRDETTGIVTGGQVYDIPFSNLTVRTLNNSSDIRVGLIAGNVLGGTIDNIGVHQGAIIPSFQNSTISTHFTSAYSLIGSKADGVDIDDEPGAGGGDAGGTLWLDMNDIYYSNYTSGNNWTLEAGDYLNVDNSVNGSIYLTGQIRFYTNKDITMNYVDGTYTFDYDDAGVINADTIFGNETEEVKSRILGNLWSSISSASSTPSTTRLGLMRLNNNINNSTVNIDGAAIHQRAVYLRPIVSGQVRFLMIPNNFGTAASIGLYEGSNITTPSLTFTSDTLQYFTADLTAGQTYYLSRANGTSGYVLYIEFDGINETGGGASGTIANIDFTYADYLLPNSTDYIPSNILFGITDYNASYTTALEFRRDSSTTFTATAPVRDFYTLYGGNAASFTQSAGADGSVVYTYNGT